MADRQSLNINRIKFLELMNSCCCEAEAVKRNTFLSRSHACPGVQCFSKELIMCSSIVDEAHKLNALVVLHNFYVCHNYSPVVEFCCCVTSAADRWNSKVLIRLLSRIYTLLRCISSLRRCLVTKMTKAANCWCKPLFIAYVILSCSLVITSLSSVENANHCERWHGKVLICRTWGFVDCFWLIHTSPRRVYLRTW